MIVTNAVKKCEGKWVMKGERAVLVHSSSATHGRPWECEAHHVQSIGRTHSDLVKYSFRDGIYERVLSVLQKFIKSAVTVIPNRFMVKKDTAFSPPHSNAPDIGTGPCE
jgi:hypothetical protein